MNMSAKKMMSAIVTNKMTSLQKNRIALNYVNYKQKLKTDELWHQAQNSDFGL